MIKNKFILLILLISILSSVCTHATTKEECENGKGEWTPSSISSPDEPIKKELIPYCQCKTGFYWNDSLKSCESDQELRCEQTGGTWFNNECQCPEGTIKWTEGFGCDMPGPEPETESEVVDSNAKTEPQLENNNISYNSLLLISIFILLVVIGAVIYYLIKNKKTEGKR